MTKWEFNMIHRDEYERVCEENRKLRDLVKAKSPMAMMQMLKRFLGGNYDRTGTVEDPSENRERQDAGTLRGPKTSYSLFNQK